MFMLTEGVSNSGISSLLFPIQKYPANSGKFSVMRLIVLYFRPKRDQLPFL